MTKRLAQELPPNWAATTLGSVTEEKVSQTGPPSTGEFTYIDISSIDNKTKRISQPKILAASSAPSRAKQNLKVGDVLVSMTRPNLNAVAVVPPSLDGAIGSTGFHVLRAIEFEPRWLFCVVQTNDFVDSMCRVVQGALYLAVRPKDIRGYEIPVPPVEEQKRIVAEIEKQFTRLEAGVGALQRVQANLKRYRAAVLKAACEGRLVPTEAELAKVRSGSGVLPLRQSRNGSATLSATFETGEELLQRILTERRKDWSGRGKYREPTTPDTSSLPHVPKGWTWATVEQLGEVTTGFTPPKGNAGFFGGNIPFFKPTDLDTGYNVREFRDSLTEAGAEHGRLLRHVPSS